MIIGGLNYNQSLGGTLGSDNFSPLASVFLLRLGNREGAGATEHAASAWLWAVPTALVLGIVAAFLLWKRRRQSATEASIVELSDTEGSGEEPNTMSRIRELMEQQQLYLNSELKLADVAAKLGTNRNVVSACINSQHGCSFSQFVNDYRVGYAQQMMRRQPDIKISEVWISSGFSTESSFFRAFKASTGMTPTEWKAQGLAPE